MSVVAALLGAAIAHVALAGQCPRSAGTTDVFPDTFFGKWQGPFNSSGYHGTVIFSVTGPGWDAKPTIESSIPVPVSYTNDVCNVTTRYVPAPVNLNVTEVWHVNSMGAGPIARYSGQKLYQCIAWAKVTVDGKSTVRTFQTRDQTCPQGSDAAAFPAASTDAVTVVTFQPYTAPGDGAASAAVSFAAVVAVIVALAARLAEA